MTPVFIRNGEIRLRFDAEQSRSVAKENELLVDLAIPVLGGADREILASIPDGEVFTDGIFKGIRSENLIAGVCLVPLDGAPPEDAARQIYSQLLSLTAELPAFRAWNYVPKINAEHHGIESYRSFNIGRWAAYQDAFGDKEMDAHLPAASAVGIAEDTLAVAFLGGKDPAQFFENPNQVPAYQYPAEYGPRSPSFARGAVITSEDSQKRTGYLSGTSSIIGHNTIGVGDLAKQCQTTFDNVRVVIERMGFGEAFAENSAVQSSFRVYIRNQADFEQVRDLFFESVPGNTENTVFLKADICRQALLLEVEGVVAA